MEKLLTESLASVRKGRRIGWLTAQSKAAELVLNACGDSAEGMRLYKMIMNLEDK